MRRTLLCLAGLAGLSLSLARPALAQHTYYISSSLGADANTVAQAQNKATPWAHLPGMPSCAASCAAYTPVAGDSFILNGGDTWGAADLGIYWNWSGSATSCVLPYGSGATSSCIYIGVDQTWWNASVCGAVAWCRPIFNAGADVANGAYILIGQPSPTKNYIVFDNIEMTGLYSDATGTGTKAFEDYGADHVEFMNSYIHGWIVESGSTGDGLQAFGCATNNGGSCATTLFHDNIVDGIDTAGYTNAAAGAMFATYGGSSEQIYNNYYRYVSGALVGASNTFHDNTVEYPVDSYDGNHCNMVYNFGPASGSTVLVYNNVIRHSNNGLGCVNLWIDGLGTEGENHTAYMFNNVMYDLNPGNLINLADHPAGPYGPRYLLSNTVECGNDTQTYGCGVDDGCTPGPGGCYATYELNNHWIGPADAGLNGYCLSGGDCAAGGTQPPSVDQSVAAAAAQGYNDTGETYAFSPASGCTPATCATVQGGTNLQAYCAAIASIDAAAGAACLSSSTFGVGYDTTRHVVITPGLQPIARPLDGGAWDTGAYQYVASNTSGATGGSTTTSGSSSSGTSGSASTGTSSGSTGGTSGACETSTANWQSFPFTPQTGSFTAEFDSTPSTTTANAVTGLSDGTASDFTSLATIVRFNPTGTIDARNGGAYAALTSIPYAAGRSYHFRLAIDIPSHTYSAYVTPPGATEQAIGTDYAFRSEQAAVTELDDWAIQFTTASHEVCNFSLEAATGGSTGATGTTGGASTTGASSSTGGAGDGGTAVHSSGGCGCGSGGGDPLLGALFGTVLVALPRNRRHGEKAKPATA